MKILFIKPPQEGFFHTTERHFPTGILYLAESCRKNNHDVDILDCLTYKNQPYAIPESELTWAQKEKISQNPIFDSYIHYGTNWENIEAYITESHPDYISLSIMFSCFYDSAYSLATKIKRRFPKIIILAGGAHISTLYRHALDNHSIDYCLRYEGENTLPSLINEIAVNPKPYNIPGIAFRDQLHPNDTTLNGYPIYCNETNIWISELDTKTPAYELVDYSKYHYTVTLITSRGCPYACSFCTVHLSMGKTFRVRSIESVVQEIEKYWSMGIHTFNIEDDNFSLDIMRAESIFQALIQKDIHASFYLLNGVIANNVTAQSMKIFAEAGVKKMFFGLETTSDQRLKELHKKHTSLEIVKNAISVADQNGIQAGVSLIIGFPNQTIDELLNEIGLLVTNDILILAINPLYPIPGTQMYQDCIAQGILTGHEDFITLGGDNFPIHSAALSQVDQYYIWVAVRAICKWNAIGSRYLPFEKIQIIDCLKSIADRIGDCSVNADSYGFKLIIPSCRLYNEIYSNDAKVLADMLTALIYIRTGCYTQCKHFKNLDEEIMCFMQLTDSPIPFALYKLRTILNHKHS